MKAIIIFLFTISFNFVSCQTNTDYEIIKNSDSGCIKNHGNQKKYSKLEQHKIHFAKSVASTLSKDFFSKVDIVNFTYETVIIKKKDTIHYVIYDFMLKKDVEINQLKDSLNFGIKSIDGYKAPTNCVLFLNDDKICCICKDELKSEIFKDETFINKIKADTEIRLKNNKPN